MTFGNVASNQPAAPTILSLGDMQRGEHFRAYSLRSTTGELGPFLGVDHAWMSAPTFPLHPHVGISAVSYLFADSETGIHNRDSIGNSNLIQPGGLHWTTAGRGIRHEEVPAQTGLTVHSLQIFVALAPDQQDIAPFALSLVPQEIPMVRLPGATVRVPLGRFGDARSPLQPPTDVTMLDVMLEPKAELKLPVATGDRVFVMPIAGALMVNGQRFDAGDHRLPVFGAQDAPYILTLQSPHGSTQAVVFIGRALPASAT